MTPDSGWKFWCFWGDTVAALRLKSVSEATIFHVEYDGDIPSDHHPYNTDEDSRKIAST